MDFISDDDMKKLEGKGAAPDVISDEEMAGLAQKPDPNYKVPKMPTPLTLKGQVTRDAYGNEIDFAGAMGNALAGGGAGALGKVAPALKGVIGSILEGGAMGAAQSPDDRLGGFLKGGGAQGALSGLGKALGKSGDIAMQVAVGRKKYTPGVGTKLADEGLWGTQGGMKKQVESGLSDSYEQMLRSAEGAAPVDSRAIGTQVYDDVTGPMTGRGRMTPSSADVPKVTQAREFADDIRARGEEPATIALERRKAAGKRAYSEKTDAGRSTPMGDLSKKEQILYSDALKKADATGKLAEADARYAALKRAERGLNEETSLPRSMMGVASFTGNKLPGGALVSSSVGQAGVKGGRLAEFLAPLSRQAAVGGSREPSAEELSDYEQYLRETGQK